jgi:hypothetical protein
MPASQYPSVPIKPDISPQPSEAAHHPQILCLLDASPVVVFFRALPAFRSSGLKRQVDPRWAVVLGRQAMSASHRISGMSVLSRIR